MEKKGSKKEMTNKIIKELAKEFGVEEFRMREKLEREGYKVPKAN